MKMRLVAGSLLGAASILLLSDTGFAQQRPAEWVLGVDKDTQEELGLKKPPRVAHVRAKAGRNSSFVLTKCNKNAIEGRFDDDPTLNVEKLSGGSDTKKIFVSYDGLSAVSTFADNGYAPWYVALPMPPRNATTINLCPTAEAAGSRCLRFPIEGFAKARQFVCGK
ncbi:hypothetical protein [Bosea sp. (in: a-proteobacteria)]|jgi:hypothetical protein|uniref:hypothetical protein n=2 Tax=Bosea sp. (in: a-proteobacteria) TaxID=1871050 RepID=UPI0008697123|nr:hypothetical protein [Bosea sp. (in: a-proteobacteria)]MBN9436983.1 hypothetical protein [Bosea sp. (in: a-proteobacteria)]ODT45356.1 MAG: hypothetical protein ABS59_17525 [Methylobacterium sp. SCN 67-24]